jgi:heat shock protein HslJ
MKTHQQIFLVLILLIISFSCKKAEIIENPIGVSTLIGKWKLTGILLGDVVVEPCNGNSPTRDITIEFTNLSAGFSGVMSLSGQSTVNDYFGSYEADSKGVIKISAVGGTKRGGSVEMMQCEDNYYTFLMNSQAYRVVQIETNPVITMLELGVFRDNPKDKGQFLIFEKIN